MTALVKICCQLQKQGMNHANFTAMNLKAHGYYKDLKKQWRLKSYIIDVH